MSYTGGWVFESPSSAFVLKQQLKTRWANRSRLVQATIVYYFIIYLLSIIGYRYGAAWHLRRAA